MSLLITGLNSALQKRFHTTTLTPGNVHRANKIEYDIGGKGQNCITTLSHLSACSNTHLLQFVGKGQNGDTLLQMLKEKRTPNIDFLTVRPDTETRVATTVISDDEATEFVDPSGVVTNDDVESLLQLTENNDYKGILFMGSLPTSCPIDIYSKILSRSKATKIVVIDTVHGLPQLFQTITLGMDAMLKINMAELFRFLNIKGKENEMDEMDDILILQDAASSFHQKYLSNTKNVALAITDGKHPAYFIQYHEKYSIYKIQIPNVITSDKIYPIGAGDAVAASTIAAWYDLEFSNGLNADYHSILLNGVVENKMLKAFVFGLACGSASCLQSRNSAVDRDDVESLFVKMVGDGSVLQLV